MKARAFTCHLISPHFFSLKKKKKKDLLILLVLAMLHSIACGILVP